MSTRTSTRSIVAIGLLALLSCWAATAASAFEVIPTKGEALVVQLNEGTLVRLDQTPKAVVIANADIADISIRSPTLMYVFGKRTGETTMYAVDAREHVLFNITLRVVHNISRLKEALAELVPAGQVEVQSLDSGILLQGAVATPAEADDALRLVSHFVGKGEDVINRLQVMAPNQVNLRVRIAEVSRTVVRQLGIDWSAVGSIGSFTFGLATQNFLSSAAAIKTAPGANTAIFGAKTGRWDVNSLIDALATQGLVTLLAEPNLTALSGETASFLAGGQYPIPVPQSTGGGSVITITYKNYGVSLSFTPTLVAGSRINMRVQPEVSQLDTTNAITVGSYVVPALTTREAQTTIELASGQSFAIAGLIQNNSKLANNSVPGLGDIPVLGELFKSDKFQRDQTELVIIVTPYIVTPVSAARLPAPTDATVVPETSGLNPQGGTSGILPPTQPQQSQAGGLNGPAGFGVE